MWRSMSFLMLAIFGTALPADAISVYILHDVDHDRVGHWNEAFAGLCTESVLFALVIGVTVGLLTLLGRYLFHLRGYYPRAKLSLFLGIGVTVFQYPWDIFGRMAFPTYGDFSLSIFLIVAIVLCTIILLRDNFRQMKSGKVLEALPSV